jgi:putative membrane protein
MKAKLKTVICSITLLVAAWTATGFAAETTSKTDKIAKEDADFVNEVALGGMMEVQLGKAAQDHGSKPQVKEFGRRMQTDHSKANDELKKIATKKDIKLPTDLAGKQKSTYDKLTKLNGAEFDSEYMITMVDDHKEDIEKFQQEADKGKDPAVKKFAKDHLPILKKHLALAEQTQKQLSSKAK